MPDTSYFSSVQWYYSSTAHSKPKVLASGIACFFLKEGLIKTFTAGAKVPLYAMLGISFAFTITYSFSEIANISPWDRCCGTNGQENPIFGSQQQVCIIFSLFNQGRSLPFLLSLSLWVLPSVFCLG
jgi:hypothetical protein